MIFVSKIVAITYDVLPGLTINICDGVEEAEKSN